MKNTSPKFPHLPWFIGLFMVANIIGGISSCQNNGEQDVNPTSPFVTIQGIDDQFGVFKGNEYFQINVPRGDYLLSYTLNSKTTYNIVFRATSNALLTTWLPAGEQVTDAELWRGHITATQPVAVLGPVTFFSEAEKNNRWNSLFVKTPDINPILLLTAGTPVVHTLPNPGLARPTPAPTPRLEPTPTLRPVPTATTNPESTPPTEETPTLITHSVYTWAGSGGNISPQGWQTVPHGGRFSFQAQAASGYGLTSIQYYNLACDRTWSSIPLTNTGWIGFGPYTVNCDVYFYVYFAVLPTPTPTPTPLVTPLPTNPPVPTPTPLACVQTSTFTAQCPSSTPFVDKKHLYTWNGHSVTGPDVIEWQNGTGKIEIGVLHMGTSGTSITWSTPDLGASSCLAVPYLEVSQPCVALESYPVTIQRYPTTNCTCR